MLLHGGETPNVEKPSNESTSQRRVGGFARPEQHYLQNGQNQWNPQGRAISALTRFGENARMISEPVWLQRIQHQQSIMEPPCN